MNNNKLLNISAIACLLLVGAGACSRDDGDAATALTAGGGLLQYIPADSPYVVAAAEPLPEDVRDAIVEKTRPVMEAYANMARVAITEQAADEDADESARRISQELVAEFTRLMTPEGLESAGIDRHSTAAVYGHGLWPVLRVSLSDDALMEGTLTRLEEKIGAKMPSATVDGHRYRIAEGEDEATIVIAVIDGYLVASLVPAEPADALLRSVLGLDLPARNIADAGVLARLAGKYGYTSYGIGFLDVVRVIDMFLDGQSGLPQVILDVANVDASNISDVCRKEARSLAGVMPRIVAGYTEITAERMVSNTVLELRSDIATGLATIPAPVPGLGQKGQGGLVAFGVSFNPQAARDFYAARLDALEADPYECEWFDALQNNLESGRAALNQPLPPVVYSFRGFLAVVENISGMDIESGQPPTDIDMRLLVATDNAEALVAMGAMFSPEIAALDLKPDSKPVRLPVPPVAAQVETAWVAMSDSALALSVGEGNEAQLPDMLAAPLPEPAPFMSLDMDAGAYYGFIADVSLEAVAKEDGEDRSREFQEAFSRTMKSLEEAIDRILWDMHFSERGIECPSTVELAD